jgi:hypothetical protein
MLRLRFDREDFMRVRVLIMTMWFALAAGSAFAHGDKVHVIGTVDKINSDSVLVKTKEGKSVEVKLTASTVYLLRSNNQDKPAKVSDLALGYLVVIHATPKDSTLEADEVKFSVPNAPKTKAAAPAVPKPNS